MKTKINLCATVIGLLFVANTLQAQWTLSGSYVYNNPLTTKVGFGTTTPQVPIDIVGGSGARFLLYGQGGTTGYQSGMGVNLGQVPNSMGFFIGKNANFSIDVANVSEAFPYPSGYSTKFTMLNNGNVGIGIPNPVTKLQVNGAALFSGNTTNPASAAYIRGNNGFSLATTPDYTWWNNDQVGIFHPASNVIGFTTVGTERVRIDANGYVGINNTNPLDRLDVIGNIRLNDNVLYLRGGGDQNHGLRYAGTNAFATQLIDGPVLFGWSGGALGTMNTAMGGQKIALTWNDGGNVGIGTMNPGSFKLAVEGKIGAREIKVTLANPWPDYVFESDYKKMSLEEIETYVKSNKHLPGVPSAEEIAFDKGVDLGAMQLKQMEKTEDIYLQLIELNKKLEALTKENQTLTTKVNELKSK